MTNLKAGDWVVDADHPKVRGKITSVDDAYVWFSYYDGVHGIPHSRAKKLDWGEA